MRSEIDLERALTDLAAHIDVAAGPDLAGSVVRRLSDAPAPRARRWPALRPVVWTRRSILVAVALLVAASSVAVASYFGVRGVRVKVGQRPTFSPGAGVLLDLGLRTDLGTAQSRVAFPIKIPGALGSPDEVYFARDLTGGRVTLLYHPRAGLPEAGQTQTGLLVMEFEGSFSRATMEKTVEPDQFTTVRVSGAAGLWIEGVHSIGILDATGDQRFDSLRLSDSVLLWQVGSVTYRLESALTMDEALRIAETVR